MAEYIVKKTHLAQVLKGIDNKADKEHTHSLSDIVDIEDANFNAVQSDYNENDSSSPSFINNRPCYVTDEVTTVSYTPNFQINANVTSLPHTGLESYMLGLATTQLINEESFANYRISVERIQDSVQQTSLYGLQDIVGEPIMVNTVLTAIPLNIPSSSYYPACTGYIVYDVNAFNQQYNSSLESAGVYLGSGWDDVDDPDIGTISYGTRMASLEYDEQVIHKLDNKFIDVDALKKEIGGVSLENKTNSSRLVVVKPNSSDTDFLENTLGFEGVPIIKRNTGEVDLWVVSNGYGGRIVARTPEGYEENNKAIAAGNICLVPEAQIPNEGNYAASVDKVNTLIANSGINVGSYLVKKPEDGESTMTIPIRPKGQYIVRGGTTTIDGFQGDCEFHMLVFFASGNDYIPNKVFHLFQKEQNVIVGTIPSIGSELIDFTGDSITIRSTDTQYGSWIITEN